MGCVALEILVFLDSRLLLVLQGVLDLGEVKLLAGAPLEDVEHVLAGSLKVGGRVVRLGDEHLREKSVT